MQHSRDQQPLAKIICVYNEKGGAGKTTVACQLAGTLGLRGYDVLIADLDSQQASSTWASMQGGANFPAAVWTGFRYGAGVPQEIRKLSEKYQIIIADCAPSVEQASTWGMLLISDLALIPTKLSPPDMAALPAAKRLARRASDEARRAIPTRVVANGARLHMTDDREFFSVIETDKDYPPMKTVLGDRKAFSRSMVYGSTAHFVKGGNEAVREIEQITDEVLALVQLPKKAKAKK